MNEVQGKVVSVRFADAEYHAVLDVDASAACPRCAAGKGCGAGLVTDAARRVDARVVPGLDVKAGETVTISLEPGRVVRAALLVYGVPLAGAVVGAILAWRMNLGDIGAAGIAIAGLAAGLVAARWRLRRSACLAQYEPVITSRVSSPGKA